MFRILYFVFLSAFVTCNPHWSVSIDLGHNHKWGHAHKDWGNHDHHHHLGYGHSFEDSDQFDDFADELIRLDRRAQTLCNIKYNVEEVYNKENYEIVVTLRGIFAYFALPENNIAVKIKHRLVEIKVQKYELVYKNLIVVPPMVNPQQATWNFANKELHITMPYMFGQQNEIKIACYKAINEKVITVAKVDPPSSALFDFRSLSEELAMSN